MSIDWLLERMATWAGQPALVRGDRVATYEDMLEAIGRWQVLLAPHAAGEVVALYGDYTLEACALFLALIDQGAIVVPLTQATAVHRDEFLEIAEAECVISPDEPGAHTIERRDVCASHPLIQRLRASGEPGLVLFSSGSTGKSKAALHAILPLLERHRQPRRRLCTITFLLLDHIGGINTLFYTVANGGTVASLTDRGPESVCRAIEQHGVELLPTSPTFLNLLLLSGAYARYDLSSLRLITYGTEVMPESTLQRVHEVLPGVELKQTYGLTEVGILGSKSRDSGSVWVKVGGAGYRTKVVDGVLWIKSESAMLGYLNAPCPFDDDGWLNTGDLVEVDGDYVRILGRESEIINVGGQKVYPAEVESVLLQMPNVRDAVAFGEPNPIMGSIVAVRVNLQQPEEAAAFRQRMRLFCRDRLAAFKVPVRVEITEDDLYSTRLKRIRRRDRATSAEA